MKIKALLWIGLLCCTSVAGQQADSVLTYRVELGGTAGGGTLCTALVYGKPLRGVECGTKLGLSAGWYYV